MLILCCRSVKAQEEPEGWGDMEFAKAESPASGAKARDERTLEMSELKLRPPEKQFNSNLETAERVNIKGDFDLKTA
jgi:hypothetical protein